VPEIDLGAGQFDRRDGVTGTAHRLHSTDPFHNRREIDAGRSTEPREIRT
jgi:hypothetical protein